MASSKAKVGVNSETSSLKESKSNASSSAEDASPNNRIYCLDDLETVATVGELTTTFDLSVTVRVSYLRLWTGCSPEVFDIRKPFLKWMNFHIWDLFLKNIKLELVTPGPGADGVQGESFTESVLIGFYDRNMLFWGSRSFAGVFSGFLFNVSCYWFSAVKQSDLFCFLIKMISQLVWTVSMQCVTLTHTFTLLRFHSVSSVWLFGVIDCAVLRSDRPNPDFDSFP